MDRAVLVHLRGSASYAHVAVLQECLQAISKQEKPVVVLDLSGLTFISTIGLRALLTLQRCLTAQGRRLKLTGLQPNIYGVFLVSRLDRVFQIYPDLAQALA